MGRIRNWAAAITAIFVLSGQAMAVTFVYVSNAEEGDIGLYLMQPDGTLQPGPRFKAEKLVMPMAVSRDKRFLVAAVRTKPYLAYTYSIHRSSGALQLVSTGPLAESFPYISFDRTSRWLFGASYGANLVSVNPVGPDGRIGEPAQVIPTARNAHAIHPDRTNRFAFVPHLGTDQVFQFLFDEKTGKLTANTPPLVQLKTGTGPRHLQISADNRFVYLLNELTATVTTLALDAKGCLSEVSSTSILPPESKLGPGQPRLPAGVPGAVVRDTSNDIWASDLHLARDERFLYAAERTSSTINALRVDKETGKLTYIGSTPTEKQPRGFAVGPAGRYMVVTGEKSDTISSYAIDQQSGALKLIGKYPTGKGSNWVEIVAFD
jgi:6-phosphogluconolactonase